jgi:hypothetical protein
MGKRVDRSTCRSIDGTNNKQCRRGFVNPQYKLLQDYILIKGISYI